MTPQTPRRVEVAIPVEGTHVLPENPEKPGLSRHWFGDRTVDYVQWSAYRGAEGVTVSVTAFSNAHNNRSWYRPSPALAGGLDTSQPPSWVPPAPDWFEAVAEQMTRDAGEAAKP